MKGGSEIMKIYGIVKSSGSYDDYRAYTHNKLFIKEDDAEKEKQRIMKEIKTRRYKADKCSKCKYIKDYREHRLKGLSNEEFKLKYKCSNFGMDNIGIYCENWSYDKKEHVPTIEEYELEEV